MISTILLVIIAIFFPPAAVAIIAGCGADLCINILLTILGFFPGHIHAFYVLYVYNRRREQARAGVYNAPAPGVYSNRVQAGGVEYVNMPPPAAAHQQPYAAAPAGEPAGYEVPPGYGTVAPPPPQQHKGV